ncbi:MAG: GNAT family N-acetyltransferase [Pseudonocardiaceae bacterium]
MNGWAGLTERIAGEIVVVEPLASEHEGGLFTAGQDRDIWRYLTAFPNACDDPVRFHRWMVEAMAATDEGTQVAWAILDRSSGTPIGSTRYLALRPEHHGLEIGWTWIGKAWWRTGANVETKLLLLGHAFDTLGCERVELKTDARNERSRAAMQALPARFEGIHRRHMKVPDGWRDTAWYSIIAPEWPDVRTTLQRRLARHGLEAYARP